MLIPAYMALRSKQLAELLKLRALGWSQEEIADAIGTSRQVVGYQLKKLKAESKKKGTSEVFQAPLIGGAAGTLALVALMNELFKESRR